MKTVKGLVTSGVYCYHFFKIIFRNFVLSRIVHVYKERFVQFFLLKKKLRVYEFVSRDLFWGYDRGRLLFDDLRASFL